MAQRKRRGFTIVELVIVIAVIAILAGVLIPTFISVINKANVASDTSLVKNINEALIAEEVTEGKPATMYEALQRAEANGFTIEKLTPRSTGDIVWNSESNRFALVDGDKTVYSFNGEEIVPSAKIWKIVDSAADVAKNTQYSSYIKGATTVDSLTVKMGVDVGENTVTALTLENSESNTYVVRTNGGTLNINAANATVKHYGFLQEANIVKVGRADCYHEFGEVKGKLNVTDGKVVLQNSASVSFVNIATSDVANISIEINSGAEYGRVTAASEDVLASALEKISAPSEVKTLVASSDVVAIVNGKAYSDLKGAFDYYKNEKGATLELFRSFDGIYMNADNTTYSLVMPENGTLDGHGYQISGSVCINMHAKGGTLKNINFYGSYNNVQRTPEQIERYGNAARGNLSSVYAHSVKGNIVFENCQFDSADWDAIQIVPLTGAKIDISNCVFRHSDQTWQQNRYIHVQSTLNCDFTISVKYCDFYDMFTGVKEQAFEVYYPAKADSMVFVGNYFNGIDISRTYTASEACKLANGHFSCVGYGTSYNNYCQSVLNGAVSTPNN